MASSSGYICLSPSPPLGYLAFPYPLHHQRLLLFLLLVLSWLSAGEGIVFVHNVTVPTPGIAGDPGILECHWSAGDTGFYSVRWYKDGDQFYSFIPRNRPVEKVDHNLPGVAVSLSKSNEHQVSLRKIDLASEGTYRCELMSEAPTFQTSFASANLTVVKKPEGLQLIGLQDKYTEGDTLRVNCSVMGSRPPARITFRVNEKLIHPRSGRVREFPTIGGGDRYALSTSVSELTLPLGNQHTPRVTIQCLADVLSVPLQNSTTVSVDPRGSSTFSFFNAGVRQTSPALLLTIFAYVLTYVFTGC